jgi:sporulation protein YlmC with PRC-barrel domain
MDIMCDLKKLRKEAKPMLKWRRREEIVGKEAIDSEAKKAGVTKDLAWSTEGKLALILEKDKGEEYFLPFDEIEKIGDVVFIKSPAALEAVPSRLCPACKHRNLMDAKFCARCGKTLEEK